MSIRDNFSHPRGKLGRLMLRGMNIGHTPMAKWTLDQFDWPVKADILDIGCGGGMNIKRMLALCPEGRVLGIDISQTSVATSRAVNKDENHRCRIYQGNVEKLPFKAACLDIVTAFETVYFWPDPAENFKEVARVLRPNGKFIVSFDSGAPDAHWEEKIPNMTAYTADQLSDYMLGAGFEDIEIYQKKNMMCICGHKRTAEDIE